MADPAETPSIYSLYCPISRNNSSTEESDGLLTPSSEIPLPSVLESHSEEAKPTGLGIRNLLPTVMEAREELGPSGTDASDSLQDWQRRQEDVLTLQPRKSTKELVRKFESVTSETSTGSSRSCHPAQNTVSRRSTQEKILPGLPPPTFQGKGGKPRSPLRQSFRNLISVFKKNKSLSNDKVDLGASLLLQYPGVRQDSSYSSDSSRRGMPHSTTMVKPTSSGPSRLMTGSVLYLSRPSSDSRSTRILAVWSSCTATLFPAYILLTSFSTQNNPLSRTVSLAGCTDVRSINMNDLMEDDKAMLPSSSGGVGDDRSREPRVFELLFDSSRKEIFASSSVKERAAWVSAIWDAILNTQDRKSGRLDTSDIGSQAPGYFSCYAKESRAVSLQRAPEKQLPRPSRLPQLNRSLPPTPICSPPINRSNNPGSPNTAIQPARAHLAPPDRPRQASPSIRALDKRSMVTQRLAQLEFADPGSRTPPIRSRSNAKKGAEAQGVICTRPSPESRSAGSMVGMALASGIRRGSTSSTDAGRRYLPASSAGQDHVLVARVRDAALPEDMKENWPETVSQSCEANCHKFSGSMSEVKDLLQAILHELRQEQDRAIVRPESSLHDMRSAMKEFADQFQRCFENDVKQNMDRLAMDSSTVVDRVDGLQTNVESGWARVLERLEQIQRQGLEQNDYLEKEMQTRAQGSSVAIAKLADRIDDLMRDNRRTAQRQEGQTETRGSALSDASSEGIAECLKLLREGNANRATDLENQADSVRYLNELNSWLETFVNHGVSQIQTVMEDVKALRSDLSHPVDGVARQGLGRTESIERLMKESKSQQIENARLLSSLQAVLRDLREVASATNPSGVAALLEQQRAQQERMIQTLADGLSQDIRGERLRFVEAMKEATTINVHSHISQFRNELTKEVLRMSQAESVSQYRAKHAYDDPRKPSIQYAARLNPSQSGFIPPLGSRSSLGLSDGGPRPKPSHIARRL
ncbi:hypothetical protein OE88DRAFT_1200674 [Heliocybe sulcata]|uniref:PH domain-containing protein n=1 Tax=Heliocybe sulcata TaxID=5364 RepID=A0A5C3NAW1_9AGAM|nr:hypothetical protein OE88DRAFT_1200674 [Heliocybe sulcata]